MTSLIRQVASTVVVSVEPTTETVTPAALPDVVAARPAPDPVPTVPERVADAELATTGASGATGEEPTLFPQAVSDRARMTMKPEINAGFRTEPSC
jgi:hypothetical protein